MRPPDDAKGYYFGCLGRVGHYLHGVGGQTLMARELGLEDIDGRFCPESRARGHCKLTRVLGWTFLAFWDDTVDSRPGSNSIFILPGHLEVEPAIAEARRLFPDVWSRFDTWRFLRVE